MTPELDLAFGGLNEGFLERGRLRGQLVEHDRVPKSDLADGVLAHPAHRDGAVSLPVRDRGARLFKGNPQLIELRRAHPDVAPRVAGGELAHRHLGDEPTTADDH